MYTEKALQESRSFGVRPVPTLRPLGWLARGWNDMLRCPGVSLTHGLIATLIGMALAWWAHDRFWLLAGAFSGFLLVAPVLATGVYALSRAIEQGQRLDWWKGWRIVRKAWHPDGRLVVFSLLLALAGTGWVLTSASLIVGFSGRPIETPLDFLRYVLLADQGHLFEIWLGMGAVLAAPVFASSIVAIPMLLDRSIGVLGAVFTSWRVVMEHPAPTAIWAFLIMAMTFLGMFTVIGLMVVVPWLGHASWHAYRDLVEPSGNPEKH